MHLEDILVRRSGWHYYDHLTMAEVERIAGWTAEAANWSSERLREEIEGLEPIKK